MKLENTKHNQEKNNISSLENRNSGEIIINAGDKDSIFFTPMQQSESQVVVNLLKREQEIQVLENSINALKTQRDLLISENETLSLEKNILNDNLKIMGDTYEKTFNELLQSNTNYSILQEENKRLNAKIIELENEKENLINNLKKAIEDDISNYKNNTNIKGKQESNILSKIAKIIHK